MSVAVAEDLGYDFAVLVIEAYAGDKVGGVHRDRTRSWSRQLRADNPDLHQGLIFVFKDVGKAEMFAGEDHHTSGRAPLVVGSIWIGARSRRPVTFPADLEGDARSFVDEVLGGVGLLAEDHIRLGE